jgi:ADP-ribose pyrophosphatase
MTEIKGIQYPTFQHDDVEILGQRTVFQGFFRINEYKMRHRLFAGGWSDVVTREMFERGHAVVVLPYDMNSDQLVLVEQIRLGAKDSRQSPWLLEAVAGMIGQDEDGQDEDCEQVARREAAEEAGLTLGRLEPMLSYLSSPGGTTERIHLFLGELIAPVQPGIFGLPEEHEDIRVHLVSRSEAMQLLADGKIDNAATVIALQWLELHYPKIRTAWE